MAYFLSVTMKHRTYFYFVLIVCAVFAGGVFSSADTVLLRDGSDVKGIVVEEYEDRVVLSTYEGEKTIVKDVIQSISYDLPEQNLVKMGDAHMATREYDKAYFYYEKALKANRDYEPAREKMNYVMGYLFRKNEQKKIDDIKRMQEYDNWPVPASIMLENLEKKLAESLGMTLSENSGKIVVGEVIKNSPAYISGVQKGDVLIAVWSRLTGYESLENVAKRLLEESAGEIKLTIERDVTLTKAEHYEKDYTIAIGAKLDMLFDGLTITEIGNDSPAKKAGLEKGDLVIAINGEKTRYMPFDEAAHQIVKDRNRDVTFSVYRKLTIWRAT